MITLQELRDTLDYCPETGIFRWKERMQGRRSVAGGRGPQGYIRISINYESYAAHRLAWLYVYGKWPIKHIDHINRNPSDNRIENLREANDAENGQNKRLPKNNTSGYLGVTWNKVAKKWQAQIIHEGIYQNLGYYDDAEEAAKAYQLAKQLLHTFDPVVEKAESNVDSLPEVERITEKTEHQKSPMKYVRAIQYKDKTYYNASVYLDGKSHEITGFPSPEEAHAAAMEIKQGRKAVEDFKKPKTITIGDLTMTRKQWADYLRIDISVLYKQAKKMPFEEAVRLRLPLSMRGSST